MIVREVKASDDDGFMEVGVVEGSDHCHHQTGNLLVDEDSKASPTQQQTFNWQMSRFEQVATWGNVPS